MFNLVYLVANNFEHENFRNNCTTSPYLEHCDRLRSLASSGTGRLWDLSRLEKYCGEFEQEEVSESQKKIEDLRDFAPDPQMRKDAGIVLSIGNCEKDDLAGRISDSEKDSCDALILRIQAECEADSSVIFCSKTGPENFNPMESYIERNDLESTEDSEEEEKEEDNE